MLGYGELTCLGFSYVSGILRAEVSNYWIRQRKICFSNIYSDCVNINVELRKMACLCCMYCE